MTSEKARKSQQMQFRDKTAYVWDLRYRWDPLLSMKPLRRFAHFLPPWSALSTLVEIVIATQWVRRTGQGQKHFEDDHSDAEADRSLHLTHRLSHLHSRLLDHRPCQVLLFRRRPGPQHVRLSYNWSRLMEIAPKCLRSSLVINSKQFTFNNKFQRKKTTLD